MSRTVLARLRDVPFADGSAAHVELVRSDEPVPEAEVFAAMVVLQDADGRYAVVFSPRRDEWGPPGGAREPGETVVECVLREVREETGLVLAGEDLAPWGQERFEPQSAGRWPAAGGAMQLYRARIGVAAPQLRAAEDDAVDPHWVSVEEFRSLSGDRFWWPLIEEAPPSGPRAHAPG
ncbi:8-oxo-dGTP pyrophosphatase MutT (NUDIX family) [Phycicoccus badiiscoriae]|uniref:8-oxo-dGTP pyrophosphatase MutT (NUDIX family) n=1 Tax=Pedococcus badiiscoriae TaxID=642776 RepID=A0A852WEP5_9MICO|nr:NUDIX hydrolase [Pedococcus badiiscoriae]NYG07220.1 8-oxo-dGTP pyrophosphatase MutT (NUDIX family) [Pedococcus badiiscoriae]